MVPCAGLLELAASADEGFTVEPSEGCEGLSLLEGMSNMSALIEPSFRAGA